VNSRPYPNVLEATLGYAKEYLESLAGTSVSAGRSLAELRARLDRPLNDEGIEPTQVIRELVADTSGGIVGSAGGRYFGWVLGGAVPAALAADWLVSAWDQNAASYACAPAEIVIEEIAATWIKELLSLPSSASVAFITGCQMAHLTCLAAARNGVLAKHGWDVERKGLVGAPAIRILSGNHMIAAMPSWRIRKFTGTR
jgi:glutamate/tyrosine decarboxylase-like PLP-dependent enzyme